MIKRLVKWWEGFSVDADYALLFLRITRQVRRERPDLSFFPRMHLVQKALDASLTYAQIEMAVKYGAKPNNLDSEPPPAA